LQCDIETDAEVLAIDGRFALEADAQITVRILGRTLVHEVDHDWLCHAFDREIPRDLEVAVPDLYRPGTDKRDLWELVHREKVVAAQMRVAVGVGGVDTPHLDDDLHARLLRALLVEVNLALELRKRTTDLRHHGVASYEADAGVGGV